MCARRRVRSGALRPRARPDQQAALDLRVREAADGPRDPRVRQQDGLDYTLFRPFNWIGAGLDSINTAKEGSSRVITQFLGHIVRGEPIQLVDGGTQKRAFTYIDDGIAALMKIIENPRRRRDAARSTTSAIRRTTIRCASSRTMMLTLARAVSRIPRQRGRGDDRRDDGRRVLRQRLPGRAEPRAEDRQHAAPTSTGRRRSAWTTRCGGSSTRTAGTSPTRARWSSDRRGLAPADPMRLGLKIDVDTLRGTREGVPRLARAAATARRRARRSCSRSAPTTPDARSGASSARASSARCAARRSFATTACARCCTEPAAGARHRAPRAPTCCGACAAKGTKPASTAGTTSAGRTASRPPTPNGRGAKCSARATATPTSSRSRRRRTARPAGR